MAEADWYQVKLLIEHASGVSMDALHIIVGFLIFMGAAALTKRGLASPLPLFGLLVLELANEAYDLRVERWPDPGMQYGEGIKDILLTIFLPVILFAVARRRPHVLTDRRKCSDDI
jgi:hypothetical protein